MTRIKDEFANCAIYLYPTTEDASAGAAVGGSGFLVGVPPEWGTVGPDDAHIYAVTNAHVVRDGAPVIRMNTSAGTKIIPLAEEGWTAHPDGHDLAVAPLGFRSRDNRFSYFLSSEFLSRDDVADADIGIGDDVFMVGRFITHEGKQRNAPVARFGNISLMPGEPIPTETGEVRDGFLVEMRSLSGFSGSPVFWHRDPNQLLPSDKGPIEKRRMRLVLPDTELLLGVDCGHFPICRRVVQNERGNRTPIGTLEVEANSGEAVVVPAWHLLALLNQRDLVDARRRLDQERTEARGISSARQ